MFIRSIVLREAKKQKEENDTPIIRKMPDAAEKKKTKTKTKELNSHS